MNRASTALGAVLAACLLHSGAAWAIAGQSVDKPVKVTAVEVTISPEGHVGSPKALNYVPGELIVQFRETTTVPAGAHSAAALGTSGSLDALMQRFQVKEYTPLVRPADVASGPSRLKSSQSLARRAQLERLVRLKIEGDVAEAAEAFGQDPGVVYAEPNYIATAAYQPNDPYLRSSNSWGHGSEDLWGLTRINVRQAWDQVRGRGIVVAVVDTGLDHTHEDIAANVWTNPNEIAGNGIDDDRNGYVDDVRGWDFVEDDNLPQDPHGHGTHVAGTIAAVADNGIGIAGVAPQAKILPLRGLGVSGSGSISDLTAALVYAADSGADVINNSWSGVFYSQAVREAVEYARDRGSVVVAAAGNNSQDAVYNSPASVEAAITVGALRPGSTNAGFSNVGGKVDVFAPGEEVLSLAAAGSGFASFPSVLQGKYVPASGTSMAAPHVAGVVALLLERFPTLTPEQVRHILRSTAADIGPAGWDELYGYGLVNAAAAAGFSGAAPDLRAGLHTPGPFFLGSEHLMSRDTFSVTGSVGGVGFASWSLSYAPLGDQGPTGAFAGIASGSVPVTHALLGEWDASALANGRYLLRLRSSDSAGRSSDAYRVVTKDSTLVAGWPQLPVVTGLGANTTRNGLDTGPLLADLDGDGQDEVIAMIQGALHVWDGEGRTLNGFPRHLASDSGLFAPAAGRPSVGDLDGDGDLEIVVGVDKDVFAGKGGELASPIHAFHHTGEYVAGFPAGAYPVEDLPDYLTNTTLRFQRMPVLVTDLEGDGRADVVAAYGSSNVRYRRVWVTAVDGNGKTKSGWPRLVNQDYYQPELPLAVADLDGDGLKEIVSINTRRETDEQGNPPEIRIVVYGHDGVVEAQRTLIDPATSITVIGFGSFNPDQIAIADLNADGRKELLVMLPSQNQASGGDNYYRDLRVLDARLNDLPGWPKTRSDWGLLPRLVNLDSDAALELISGFDLTLQAWDSDGTPLAGYPMGIPYPGPGYIWDLQFDSGLNSGAGGPVLFATGYGARSNGVPFYGLTALDKTGQAQPGWPKNVGMGLGRFPAVSRVADGAVTVGYTAGPGHIYLWRQSGGSTAGGSRQYMADSGHTGEDPRTYPWAPAPSCKSYSGTNSAHVTAGRAYSQRATTWPFTTTYYAKGSNDNLGISGFTSVTLSETSPGHFIKGSCPPVGAKAAEVIALVVAQDGFQVTASGRAFDADNDLSRVEVQLDGDGVWRPASGTTHWSLSLGDLAVGNHVIKARAVDAGGRIGAERGPVSFTVAQPQAPTVYVNAYQSGDTVYLFGGANDPEDELVRVEVQVDGGAWQLAEGTYSWQLNVVGLAPGSHAAVVRAVDADNLTGTASVSFEVVEPASPECAVDGVVLDSSGLHIAWLSVSDLDNDLAGMDVRVDGGAWRAAQSFFGFFGLLEDQPSELAPGMHTVEAQAYDLAGHYASCTPLQFEVAPPSDPSVVSLTVEVSVENSTVYINGQAEDPNQDVARVELEFDGNGNWIVASGTVSFYYELTNPPGGTHAVRARAIDSRGAISPVYGPVSFVIDAPAAPTLDTIGAVVTGQQVKVSGTASDADNDLALVEVQFDGSGQWLTALGTANWSYTTSSLAAGTHSVRARATDAGGRMSAASAPVSFTIAASAQCFTAANSAHASAGRATLKYSVLYYANGSNDYLGWATATTSLQQQGAGYWKKVTSCP